MREIKFRAFVRKEGGRYRSNHMFSWEEIKETIDAECGWYKSLFSIGCDTDQDSVVLMQFTGLKDKNGKEIYEGDIVRAKHTTVPVWWNQELVQYEFSDPKDREDYIVYNGEEFEVIGNIYENPELVNSLNGRK